MGLQFKKQIEFQEFDLTTRELSELVVTETYDKDKCIIRDLTDNSTPYDSFLLCQNSQTKTVCEFRFDKSSKTGKYLPRPTFKKVSLKTDEVKTSRSNDKVTIALSDSQEAITFWKLMNFILSFNDIIDNGDFKGTYRTTSKDSYLVEFKDKSESDKVDEIKTLFGFVDLSTFDIRNLTFEARKKNLKTFYDLLKNTELSNGEKMHDDYRNKYGIRPGEEYIWHHFLKKHDWILGLNVDLKFIHDFLDEQKVGNEDSQGSGSPQVDLLGISEFTVLVELKHTNTDIFKKTKSKGRANTWDFTGDFIEGVSQCLGQKFELEKSFDRKTFVKDDNTQLQKTGIETIDPKSILLIGNKRHEFPIDKSDNTNITKNKTLERFRRNNRNVEILTYDELFERAYHIVYSNKLKKDWYNLDKSEIFDV